MNHQDACTKGKCICNVIPPYILENIAKNGNEMQRAMANRTLGLDNQLREQRDRKMQQRKAEPGNGVDSQVAPAPHKKRLIHNAENSTTLPGTIIRSEGQPAHTDVATNEAYDGFGATYDLFWDIYKRDSIDSKGMDMSATVHYDYYYNNAFWDGIQMVFGDGDGYMFNRFTIAIDIMGHELAHGVTEHTAGLEYHDQPGALNESVSDVFGSLVKQRTLNQTADQADWLIGAGLLASSIKGIALRSMKAPGTAYDDFLLGKDPQPDHMSKYVVTTSDNGGVHINSGIPNKAFYLAAMAIGGYAWEKAGHIWYQTLIDPRLSATAQFQDFANLTVEHAGKLFNETIQAQVIKAWRDVGITVLVPELPFVQYTVFNKKDGRTELYTIGSDKALYYNSQTNAGTDTWSGWKSLGGSVRQFNVRENQDGRLEVFCISSKNNTFYHKWQLTAGTDTWSDWKSLGEALPPASVQDPDKKPAEVYNHSDEVHSYSRQSSAAERNN